jgi:iron complex transport system permease protein
MVSYVGIIGFVGLVVPHIIRMIVGGDAKFLIPASMVGGALFILVADLLSRVLIAPEELRVGLIASIIGSPIFLYIIVRRRRGYGEVF